MHAICPQCDRKLRVPEHAIGRRVECPGCHAEFQIEADVVPKQESRKAKPAGDVKPKPASREPRQSAAEPKPKPRARGGRKVRKARQGAKTQGNRSLSVGNPYEPLRQSALKKRTRRRGNGPTRTNRDGRKPVRSVIKAAMISNVVLGLLSVLFAIVSVAILVSALYTEGQVDEELPAYMEIATYAFGGASVLVMVVTGFATEPVNPKPILAGIIVLIGGVSSVFTEGLMETIQAGRNLEGGMVAGLLLSILILALGLVVGRIIAWLLWYKTLEDIVQAAGMRDLEGIGDHLFKCVLIFLAGAAAIFMFALCAGLAGTVHPIFAGLGGLCLLLMYVGMLMFYLYIAVRAWLLSFQIFLAA